MEGKSLEEPEIIVIDEYFTIKSTSNNILNEDLAKSGATSEQVCGRIKEIIEDSDSPSIKPYYSYNAFDRACKNISSGDLPQNEIDEEDFVGVPYSYLGLIHTMYEQQRKGVGTALLQLQDYFFAKYCDENKNVHYKEHNKQPMIRGLFYPSEEINRNAAADFYLKNGYSFIKSSHDLFKTIDVKQTLASADKKIMKHLYFKEQEEDIVTYNFGRQ